MQTASYFLIVAFGSAHVFRRSDRCWVGATSLEDGSADSAALLEHEGRPLVVVFGGSLYTTHLSHRMVDVSTGQVLWSHQGTVSTDVIPIQYGGRMLIARAVIGKYGNRGDVLDPLTGAPVRNAAGFSRGGKLYGSGGALYAFVDGEAGEVRIFRDGEPLATLQAPTDPKPTVSTMALGGQTFTVTEAPILFTPRMRVYLDDAGGTLTVTAQQAIAYDLDGSYTHHAALPEGTTLRDATWAEGDGWLLLVTHGDVAAVIRQRDSAVLCERAATRRLCFTGGPILRDGLSLADARTGEALPPLELPPTHALLGRLQVDEPGLFGDRLRQVISKLRAEGRIGVDPMYQRFGITPVDIRRPAERATYSAGPIPTPKPMRAALAELARWTGGKRVPLTAAALAAHDKSLPAPLPSEAIPLFASGLPHLMNEGSLHPKRAQHLKRLTEEVPEDLTPLAAFFHDLDTELTVVWAYRYTADGVAFYRVDEIRGRRGRGIREEWFTAIHVAGPLPLHTLVSGEAGRIAYAARENNFFLSEPARPPVALKICLD